MSVRERTAESSATSDWECSVFTRAPFSSGLPLRPARKTGRALGFVRVCPAFSCSLPAVGRLLQFLPDPSDQVVDAAAAVRQSRIAALPRVSDDFRHFEAGRAEASDELLTRRQVVPAFPQPLSLGDTALALGIVKQTTDVVCAALRRAWKRRLIPRVRSPHGRKRLRWSGLGSVSRNRCRAPQQLVDRHQELPEPGPMFAHIGKKCTNVRIGARARCQRRQVGVALGALWLLCIHDPTRFPS